MHLPQNWEMIISLTFWNTSAKVASIINISVGIDKDLQIVKELHKKFKPRRVFEYYCNKMNTQMINNGYSAQHLKIEPLDLGGGQVYIYWSSVLAKAVTNDSPNHVASGHTQL